MKNRIIPIRSSRLPTVATLVVVLLQAGPSLPRASGHGHSQMSEIPFRHIVVDANGPTDPWLKTVGDLNGDGRADLIVGGHSRGGLVWYENPTWTKRAIDPEGRFGTDGDGKIGIVGRNQGEFGHRGGHQRERAAGRCAGSFGAEGREVPDLLV